MLNKPLTVLMLLLATFATAADPNPPAKGFDTAGSDQRAIEVASSGSAVLDVEIGPILSVWHRQREIVLTVDLFLCRETAVQVHSLRLISTAVGE